MRINHDYLDKGSLIDEERNVDATRFFKLLKDFIEPLWNEFTNPVNYRSFHECLLSSQIMN